MPKKTDAQISEFVKEIGRMYSAGMVDREIMERLQLKKASYYAYRKRLFRDSGNMFRQTSNDELLYHKDLLQERLTRMFRRIEIDLNNTALTNKDRAGLYMAAQSYAMNIFRLNYEGIVALKNAYGNQGRPSLTAVSATIGSEKGLGSGAGVIRDLQTTDTGGSGADAPTTGTYDEPGSGSGTARAILSDAPDILEQKTEPDESEIY